MASWITSIGPSDAVTPTRTSGKTRRIPNTAIAMPMVRKIVCQKWLIRTRILALTTALSNDSETSRMIRMVRIRKTDGPPRIRPPSMVSRVAAAEKPKIRSTRETLAARDQHVGRRPGEQPLGELLAGEHAARRRHVQVRNREPRRVELAVRRPHRLVRGGEQLAVQQRVAGGDPARPADPPHHLTRGRRLRQRARHAV